MENKYYTPAIEDIHVGYECIVTENDEEEYEDILNASTVSYLLAYPNRVKTPFLTKEQIETEGWLPLPGKSPFTGKEYKWRKIIGEKETGVFNEDHIYTIEYHPSNATPQLTIHLEWESSWNRYDGNIYVGKCPSINEFRTITKLLNIK